MDKVRQDPMDSDRGFGYAMSFFWAMVGISPLSVGGAPRVWAMIAAILFFSVSLFKPSIFSPANRLWLRFSLPFGSFMERRASQLVAVGLIVAAAFSIRILLAGSGYGFDVDSYSIVSKIVSLKASPYYTWRYNYGFLPGFIFGGIGWVLCKLNFCGQPHPTFFPENNPEWMGTIEYNMLAFHTLVVCLLFVFELLVAFQIRKRYGFFKFFLFLMNPISVILIGNHSQIDILAISTGLLSVYFLCERQGLKWGIIATLLLFLSLELKHILVLFSVVLALVSLLKYREAPWMVFKDIHFWAPIAAVALFAVSFIPFYHGESKGFIQAYVIDYGRLGPGSLLTRLMDLFVFFDFKDLSGWLGLPVDKTARYIFSTLVILGTLGIRIHKKLGLEDTFFVYLLLLFAFSPQIASQYIYIAIIPVILRLPSPVAVYVMFAGTFFLMTDELSLFHGLARFSKFHQIQLGALLLAVFWRGRPESLSSVAPGGRFYVEEKRVS